jgi:hypothetical protein
MRRLIMLAALAASACLAVGAQSAQAGAWLPPQTVVVGSSGVDKVVPVGSAIGGDGTAAIAWSNDAVLGVQVRVGGAAWPPAPLPVPQAGTLDVGVDGAGTVTAIDSELAPGGGVRVVASTVTPAGLQAPVEVSPAARFTGGPLSGSVALVAPDGVIESWLRSAAGGPPLAAGTWRCFLKAGPRIAASVTFNVVD